MGSGKLLSWGLCAAVLVNLLFLLLAYSLDAFYRSQAWASLWPLVPSRGLIPLAVYGLTVHSLAAGDSDTTLLGIPIKSRYLPLALVGFFCLINGPAELRRAQFVYRL